MIQNLPLPPEVLAALEAEGMEGAEGAAPALTAPLDPLLNEQPSAPPDPDADLSPEEPDAEELRTLRIAAKKALYGDLFPGANEDRAPEPEEWADWAKDLWNRHQDAKRVLMHLVNRNRRFYHGDQWLAPVGTSGEWVEPPKPAQAARAVYNLIKPALDQRTQIVSEQRPGFRVTPVTQDPDKVKKAEAQQYALEYQYDQQGMAGIIRESRYRNGTDGTVFWQLHWDVEAGGDYTTLRGEKVKLGDVRTRVIPVENVVVSANATANVRPDYWVIKETISRAEAVAQHGHLAVQRSSPNENRSRSALPGWNTGDPSVSDLLLGQDTVDRYTVYCEPSRYLPEGLTVIVVDDVLAFQGPLLAGVVPMVRVTDGSSDPSFFTQPEMNDWIEHQIRVNAAASKWVESVRLNAGGRFLVKPRSVSAETLIGGTMSAIEVRGPGPIGENVMPVQGFRVGQDIKDLIASDRGMFEDKSGWNPASRGQYSSDASGRAILAIREQLERVFAPSVNAIARAMVDWAKITAAYMRWGYDIPRYLGVMGHNRPDLARAITKDDFDSILDYTVDEESMMPMPRALRLFLLDQMYEKGMMSADEYRRRLPFGYTRNLNTPNDAQQARALRVAEAIKDGRPVPPIRWQDDEAIHQDVLETEILTRDDLPEEVVAAADERWKALANQAAQKSGGQPAAPAPGAPAPKVGPSLPASVQPFPATNPGIAAAPASVMGNPNAPLLGGSDAHMAGQAFDLQPR